MRQLRNVEGQSIGLLFHCIYLLLLSNYKTLHPLHIGQLLNNVHERVKCVGCWKMCCRMGKESCMCGVSYENIKNGARADALRGQCPQLL